MNDMTGSGRVLSPRAAVARPAPTPARRIAALRAAGRTRGPTPPAAPQRPAALPVRHLSARSWI